MTRYAELLDELKKRRHLPSDYAAAKVLGLDTARIHFYRTGERQPDAYACTRIAIELGLDPLTLIAEVEKETERNPVRRDFWRDFFLAAVRKNAMLVAICTVFCVAASQTSESIAKSLKTNIHYTKRWLLRFRNSAPWCTSWQCY